MEESLFIKWVQKFFPGITVRVVETLNGEDRQASYLHRTMLRKEESVDGKWNSLLSDNVTVAADIVAMDSSLPLKTRPALSSANGDIPKMGMELKLNENQLTALDTLVAKQATDAQIIAKLFADTPRCITGIYEQNEATFLQGLSTGVVLVDSNNVGTGVRLDYGYLSSNKFGASVVWTGSPTPVSDAQRVISAASDKGNVINYVMMNRASFNQMRNSVEGKALHATSIGNFGTTQTIPTAAQFSSAFKDETGADIIIVERSVNFEKNGVKTNVKPWSAGKVVFLTSLEVGSLIWATLAETNHPAKNVTYSLVDDFILVSKYVLNKPSVAEFTSSQARVVPVIHNVDQIYLLDTLVVQA
ncbi:hypothetical protein [Pedobacter sp. Leaf170]|uniref:hypothetical protein n=1 Tax=Pedobacter sp. Leaf170 TaxID=2876558 RepID=UPI001E3E8211|nr:hypothetical protein [Pedobacter sp. Leaf170]